MATELDMNGGPKLEYWMLEIADLENYYNPLHKIIRVKWQSEYYDIKCNPGIAVPDQTAHLALAMLPERFFEIVQPISTGARQRPPGTISDGGTLGQLPIGIVHLVDSKQAINTTNPQTASSSFSISDTNMFDMTNMSVCISPPLYTTDYTTLADPNQDINSLGVGIFMNKQGTILIKSLGGSITLGKEGIHIGGKFASEASVRDTGVMSDNGLARLIPSTIPTAAVAIPKMPNLGSIASIANASLKYISIAGAASQIGQDIASLA